MGQSANTFDGVETSTTLPESQLTEEDLQLDVALRNEDSRLIEGPIPVGRRRVLLLACACILGKAVSLALLPGAASAAITSQRCTSDIARYTPEPEAQRSSCEAAVYASVIWQQHSNQFILNRLSSGLRVSQATCHSLQSSLFLLCRQ